MILGWIFVWVHGGGVGGCRRGGGRGGVFIMGHMWVYGGEGGGLPW